MKTAKLVRRGAVQSVRLPLEFQFEGDEVLIKRDGIAVTLLPKGMTFGDALASLGLPPFRPSRRTSRRKKLRER